MFLKIRLRQHLHLFYLATTFWTLFFLGGLWSDYYQTWPALLSLILIDAIPAALMIYLGPHLIRQTNVQAPVQAAWVVAFYFSVPFLVYDFIYLCLYLRHDLSYLLDYWYLTVFSVIPWLSFPIIGYLLENRRPLTSTQDNSS